jgi:small subunit ribosomal protein S16
MRLSRGGRKARPFYRIVVADKRAPRDGRYIERLGTYNPLLANDDENRVKLNEERIKYWLGEGAQPSERVAIFLGKAGIIAMPEQPNRPTKSAPSEKTKLKNADKEEKLKARAEAEAEAAEEAKAAEEAAKAEAEAAANAPAEEAQSDAEAEASVAEAVENADAPEAAEEKPAEAPAVDAEEAKVGDANDQDVPNK